MHLSYKFRLFPNRTQANLLGQMLGDFCDLYNAGLQQRIEAYRRRGISLTYNAQAAELKATRAAHDGLARWSYSAEQQVLRRLEKSFRAYFSRLDGKGKPGFPRFRSISRYHAAEFRVSDGLTIKSSGRVGIVGVPSPMRVKWHRPLPARPQSAILTRQNGKWYVVFHVEVEAAELRAGESVGIDAGLASLVAMSNGETVVRPNWTRRAAKGLRRRQRALARAKIGSARREKARRRFAAYSARISSRRRDFLHKVSTDLVSKFASIGVEDLNVRGLSQSLLAREVRDAAWGKLVSMIDYKAERAGSLVVKVDPRGTSQTCPGCGIVRAKTLRQREHRCECGCTLDRDVAAAMIVHLRAFPHGTCGRSPSQRVAA